MPGNVLLSTAYLPPAEYFARIADAEAAFIEKEENYIKQSYRNRCYLLTSSGQQTLTVPVYLGSLHKTPVKDIRIDYSKRWQQVHLGALVSAYGSSPFFLYYYEAIQKIILLNHEFLLDLNMELLLTILRMIKIETGISFTESFIPADIAENDLRYRISPKRESDYRTKPYTRVFSPEEGSYRKLSIVDLLFNTGPDTSSYLSVHN
jgi:hypothetical protein